MLRVASEKIYRDKVERGDREGAVGGGGRGWKGSFGSKEILAEMQIVPKISERVLTWREKWREIHTIKGTKVKEQWD